MAIRPRADAASDYFRVTDGTVETTPFMSYGLDDSLTTSPAGYTTDGKTLHWVDSRNRDTAGLFAQDTATGKMTLLAESTKADIGGALADPRTGRVQACSVDYLRNEYVALDPVIKGDLAFLKAQGPPVGIVAVRV